jgi:multimeric flavodoxin WrbA
LNGILHLHLYQKALALRRFWTTAQKFGAEAGTLKIRNLNFRACWGCYACNTKLDRCALNDDLTEVLEAVCDTYIPVLASPLYFSDISSR